MFSSYFCLLLKEIVQSSISLLLLTLPLSCNQVISFQVSWQLAASAVLSLVEHLASQDCQAVALQQLIPQY